MERDAGLGDRNGMRELGRLLSVLGHCMQARRIFEIGTGTGYITLWMAFSLPQAGKVWTIDPDLAATHRAQEYFGRAAMADRIEVVNQSPVELMPVFPEHSLDMIVVHENASHYAKYLRECVPLMKLAGLLIFNDGRLDEHHRFLDELLSRPELDTTILPVAGGTTISARTL